MEFDIEALQMLAEENRGMSAICRPTCDRNESNISWPA